MHQSFTFLLLFSFIFAQACSTPKPKPQTPVQIKKASPQTQPTSKPAQKIKKEELKAPPLAKRGSVFDEVHGVKIADPYRWLEVLKNNREARLWLKTQDDYSRNVLGKLKTRQAIHKRLAELSYIDFTSAPKRKGKYYFFNRRHKDKEKRVYYWKASKNAKPKVLIDPNTLSEDGSVSLRGIWLSWDGKKAAYALSKNASDEATLYVKDVKTNVDSKIDVIPGAKYAYPSWVYPSKGFYYTRIPVDQTIPTQDRPGHAAIYYHKLGSDPKSDRVIYPKTNDPRKFIFAHISKDARYLFVSIEHGWAQTDLYIRDLRRSKKFKPLAVGYKNARFTALSYKNKIYIMTNYRAPHFRLFRIDPKKLAMRDWEEIIPEDSKAVLRDFDIIGGHLALRYLKNAYSELRVARLNGKLKRIIKLPGIGTTSSFIGNEQDDTAYFYFSSFDQPSTVYQTSMRKGGVKIYYKLELPIDNTNIVVDQVWYPSKDGTKISMFIAHHKKMKRNGNTAIRLYGYGGFDVSITPVFRPSHILFLEAGGALAFPNLRGGGEYGETWHQMGMLENKQNVFDDFIGAAEYLIKEGYTKAEKLAIVGGSNGGLLVGAAMTQRPDLFRAVICAVPLLDMVRYHRFGSGKTWISEYGSAEDEKQFNYLHAYSPYHRIKKGTAYPALLMLSADSDDRVDPMHARKFVAKTRWANSKDREKTHPILLRVESKSGHGGGDMVNKRIDRDADTLAFLFWQLGMNYQAR